MLEYISDGSPWNGEAIGDVRHPPDIERKWSAADLAAIGLRERVPLPPAPPDLETERARFLRRVDSDAENVRLKYITDGAGQAMTYQEKADQAKELVGLGQAAVNAMTAQDLQSNYPTVAASVGIEASTAWDVADLVDQKRLFWRQKSYEIEARRLGGKKAIGDATTVADIQAAYQAIDWSNV